MFGTPRSRSNGAASGSPSIGTSRGFPGSNGSCRRRPKAEPLARLDYRGLAGEVAADFGAVGRGQAQEAEGREQRDQRDQQKDDTEILGGDPVRPGDHRQQGGADRDAETARQLL